MPEATTTVTQTKLSYEEWLKMHHKTTSTTLKEVTKIDPIVDVEVNPVPLMVALERYGPWGAFVLLVIFMVVVWRIWAKKEREMVRNFTTAIEKKDKDAALEREKAQKEFGKALEARHKQFMALMDRFAKLVESKNKGD